MMRGRFIVLEGGEACGKSTQASLLATAIGAELTREPGGTDIGEQLRSMLLHSSGPIDPRTELLLMAAARAQHVEQRLRPLLGGGRHVVCDRYSASTIAYQGYGRGLSLEDVVVACELAEHGVVPDLNVLLEVPPDLALARRSEQARDRVEREDDGFFERVRTGFRSQVEADPTHWVVIDGTSSPESVALLVLEAVTDRLGELSKEAAS